MVPPGDLLTLVGRLKCGVAIQLQESTIRVRRVVALGCGRARVALEVAVSIKGAQPPTIHP